MGDEALSRTLDLAYAYVNRRERTVAEVRWQLEGKDVAPELVDAAVETLIEQHLLDDTRYAEMYVHDKRELQQWGAERIRRGLRERGIDRELAERALSAEPDEPPSPGDGRPLSGEPGLDPRDQPVGELGRALALLRRRFPAPPADRRERDRALGVLLRKGYEPELALDALAAHAHDG